MHYRDAAYIDEHYDPMWDVYAEDHADHCDRNCTGCLETDGAWLDIPDETDDE